MPSGCSPHHTWPSCVFFVCQREGPKCDLFAKAGATTARVPTSSIPTTRRPLGSALRSSTLIFPAIFGFLTGGAPLTFVLLFFGDPLSAFGGGFVSPIGCRASKSPSCTVPQSSSTNETVFCLLVVCLGIPHQVRGCLQQLTKSGSVPNGEKETNRASALCVPQGIVPCGREDCRGGVPRQLYTLEFSPLL